MEAHFRPAPGRRKVAKTSKTGKSISVRLVAGRHRVDAPGGIDK
jgi:hypothetical protein